MPGLRRATAFALSPLAVWALSACSVESEGATALAPIPATQEQENPPGAARPLSIGGRIAVEEGDEFSSAIQCAAALGLTAQTLTVMSDRASSPHVAQIRQAENHFLDRAVETPGPAQGDAASIGAAVARERAAKADEVAGQAQLAIACLRRYGASVDEAIPAQPNA